MLYYYQTLPAHEHWHISTRACGGSGCTCMCNHDKWLFTSKTSRVFCQTKLQETRVLVVTHPDILSGQTVAFKPALSSRKATIVLWEQALVLSTCIVSRCSSCKKDKQPVCQEQRLQQQRTPSRVTEESRTTMSIWTWQCTRCKRLVLNLSGRPNFHWQDGDI